MILIGQLQIQPMKLKDDLAARPGTARSADRLFLKKNMFFIIKNSLYMRVGKSYATPRGSQPYGPKKRKRSNSKVSNANSFIRKASAIAGGSSRAIAGIPTGLVPKSQIVKLKYCTAISLNPTYTTQQEWAYHFFSANSINDPNVTGVGHQPRGHDQLATYYTRYHVLSSNIVVKAGSAGIQTQDQVIVSLGIDKDSTAPTGYPNDQWAALETPDLTWKYLADGDGSVGVKTLFKRWNAKQYFGTNWDSNASGAQFGSDPNRTAYFRVGAICADATTTNVTTRVNCVVQITYLVELNGRVDITSS